MTNDKATEVKTTRTLHAIRDRLAELDAEAAKMQAEADRLALELKTRMARGTREMKPMQRKKTPANGVPVAAVHTQSFHIGDETDSATLNETVKRCIAERPRTRQEIIELTGARANRINGALIALQVQGLPVKNLGNRYRAVWYLPTLVAK